MFSRRHSSRHSRRLSSSVHTIPPFYKLITSAPVLQAIQSDLGVTSSGGLVSTWADQSGNGKNYTAAGAAQPSIGNATVNGFPVVSFDGVANAMTAALTLPAPGTTPTYIWMIIRQNTWVVNTGFVSQDNATGAHMIWQGSGSPDILSFEGTTNLTNTAAALGAWVRLEAQWQNSILDYLKINETNVTSINTGNSASTFNRTLGRVSTAGFAKFDILALMYCGGIVSQKDRDALSAAARAKYNIGI